MTANNWKCRRLMHGQRNEYSNNDQLYAQTLTMGTHIVVQLCRRWTCWRGGGCKNFTLISSIPKVQLQKCLTYRMICTLTTHQTRIVFAWKDPHTWLRERRQLCQMNPKDIIPFPVLMTHFSNNALVYKINCLHSVTSKSQTGCPSSKIHNLLTNAANAIQFGAALCRIILLPTVASLESSLSCTFCKFIKHRQKVGIFSF